MLGVLSIGWGLTREVVMEMGTGVVSREWRAEIGHKATLHLTTTNQVLLPWSNLEEGPQSDLEKGSHTFLTVL